MAANPTDVPRHYFTLEEYFALENASDARFEYWDGDIVCMSGGSREHGTISGNVFFRLRLRLTGSPCTTFTADVAILTPTLPPYRYPDVSVACGELRFQRVRNLDALLNPTLIVEVLSPTTSKHDHEEKFRAYQAIPSFSEYLLVAQDAPHVIQYVRQPGGAWVRRDVTSLEAVVALESVGCELRMGDIYEGVTFAA